MRVKRTAGVTGAVLLGLPGYYLAAGLQLLDWKSKTVGRSLLFVAIILAIATVLTWCGDRRKAISMGNSADSRPAGIRIEGVTDPELLKVYQERYPNGRTVVSGSHVSGGHPGSDGIVVKSIHDLEFRDNTVRGHDEDPSN